MSLLLSGVISGTPTHGPPQAASAASSLFHDSADPLARAALHAAGLLADPQVRLLTPHNVDATITALTTYFSARPAANEHQRRQRAELMNDMAILRLLVASTSASLDVVRFQVRTIEKLNIALGTAHLSAAGALAAATTTIAQHVPGVPALTIDDAAAITGGGRGGNRNRRRGGRGRGGRGQGHGDVNMRSGSSSSTGMRRSAEESAPIPAGAKRQRGGRGGGRR